MHRKQAIRMDHDEIHAINSARKERQSTRGYDTKLGKAKVNGHMQRYLVGSLLQRLWISGRSLFESHGRATAWPGL